MKIDIQVPSFGESVTEASVGQILVENGQVVNEDDPLFEMESDKASVELPSPASGAVHLTIQADEVLQVGQVVGTIDTDAAAATNTDLKTSQEAPKEPQKEVSQPQVAPQATMQTQSPAAKSPKESLRISRDAYLDEKPLAKDKECCSHVQEPSTIKREKMSKMRRVIAKRLVEVKQETAMLTTFNEVDLSRIIEIRKEHKESFEKKVGAKLSFMPFFVKAACQALAEFVDVNAMIDGDDIVYNDDVNMSLAVSTPKGLLVPVIQGCSRMTFAQIALAIQDLAVKGREGKLSPSSMRGGTFTITNGGVFGSMLSTPILNPPQSAILGMHNIVKRAVVVDNQIVIRDMMYLALSYDHRIIDGRESVSFLVALKHLLENPETMLLY